MATIRDLIKDDLFEGVKTILIFNAMTETLRSQSLSISALAARGAPVDLLEGIGLEAAQDTMPAIRFLMGVNTRGDFEDLVYELANKIMILAKSFLEKQKPNVAWGLVYQVVLRIVGRDTRIPGASDSGLFNIIYQDLDQRHELLLLECFGLLLTCSCLMCDWFQALLWFEELQVFFTNMWMTKDTGKTHDWDCYRHINPIGATALIEGLTTTGNILKALQNTGAYHYFMVVVDSYIRSLPTSGPFVDEGIIPDKATLLMERKEAFEALFHIRHPDPQTSFKYVLNDSRLQVSGAWKRLPVKPNETMGRRSLGSAFIWKGYLYIAGGESIASRGEQKPTKPLDIWRVRLEPFGDWQFFSKIPSSTSEDNRNRSSGWEIRVYEDKGYLFSGRPTLDILNLKTGKWSKLKTTYRPTAADRAAGIDTEWPWAFPEKGHLSGAAQQIIKDRLLVFGGLHMKSLLGCNMLMELNLKTLRWRRLSGYAHVQKESNPDIPGPRYYAASWVDNGRLFIMHGACDKIKPGFAFNNDFGPSKQWVWDDMWSWDVEQEKWRRERIAGNPPAPRLERGYAHNEKLKKVLIFGGANPRCSHRIAGTDVFYEAAIYADTFMLSISDEPKNQPTAGEAMSGYQPGAYSWKQVMTCGFPTYRSGLSLVCDPDTGKIYMYGGQVRGEFVPSRDHLERQAVKQGTLAVQAMRNQARMLGFTEAIGDLTQDVAYRHFGHVWQLHIDIPGGHFDCIDKEDEIRTAPPGPWNRCFECGKADFWKQCGGTCGGRAHFCSRECQLKGWKLHKQMHGCKKS